MRSASSVVAIVVVSLTLGASLAPGQTAPAPPTLPANGPLHIYSSLPLSGTSRSETTSVVNAMNLALAEHGAKAGGRDIAYMSLNDATASAGRWDPDQVTKNAKRAAQDTATIGYLGEFNSGASATSMPLINEAGIAQISPVNSYVGLTRSGLGSDRGEPGKYFPTGTRTYARVSPADHHQARAIVSYLKALGARRVAIVHDDEVYGQGTASMVRAAAPRAGIKIVAFRPIRGTASARTWSAAARQTVARLRGKKFDGFVFGGTTNHGAAAAFKEAHRLAPRAKLIGGDGVAESAFASRLTRGVQQRTYVTNPGLDPDRYPPAAQAFYGRYRAKYGTQPGAYGVFGFEAMSLLLDAIDRAATQPGGLTRAAVVSAVFATRDRDSVLGTYSIDANGDTTLAEYGGYKIRRGDIVFDRVLKTSG